MEGDYFENLRINSENKNIVKCIRRRVLFFVGLKYFFSKCFSHTKTYFLNNFSMSFLLMTLSTYLPSLPSLANEKLYPDFDHCFQLIIGEATSKIN